MERIPSEAVAVKNNRPSMIQKGDMNAMFLASISSIASSQHSSSVMIRLHAFSSSFLK